MNLVQIGVNTSNDDFLAIVKSLNGVDISKIVLVEPLEEHNPSIQKCYANYNYIIENVIINDDPNKKTEEFFVSKYSWISSLKEEHVKKYGYGEIKQKLVLPATTLNELFFKHDMSYIDILFVDTEGTDDKIIMSIDFSKYNIKKIYYEHVHINHDYLKLFLEKNGYSITNPNFSDNLTSLATKK